MRFRLPRNLMQGVREALRIVRTPTLLLWALYIFLFPIYVFPSGLPQPGDMLLLPLAIMTFTKGKVSLPSEGVRPVRAVVAFTGYVIASCVIWTILTGQLSLSGKQGFLLVPLFYTYNAILFVLALILYRRYRARFLWLTLNCVLLSVVLQSVVSLFISSHGSRDTLLFNNPNQLGYYAIVSASIIALGRRRLGLGALAAMGGLVLCSYLAFLSSSRAALGSALVLLAVGAINNPRRMIAAGIGFALLTLFPNPLTRAIDKAQHRIETDDHLGFFEERGYDRIVNNKQYWILGAGEGYTKRWEETSIIGDHELHSSIGTLFFCYGIVGLSLFINLAFRIGSRSSIRRWALLLPVAAYGMTHQGLRSTLMWALLALFVCVKDMDLAESQRLRRERRLRRAAQLRPAGLPAR